MKEATGELSMTVIVIVGAIAIVGIVTFLIPKIRQYVNNAWTSTTECVDTNGDMVCD